MSNYTSLQLWCHFPTDRQVRTIFTAAQRICKHDSLLHVQITKKVELQIVCRLEKKVCIYILQFYDSYII
jgi:hypothetical protein